MVESSVTTESHPASLTSNSCCVVRAGVCVSIYPGVAITMALNINPVLEVNMVKSSVTTESHPASLTKVTVAVLLELVYVFPSIQV